MLIGFDIDGTIADLTHRRHFVTSRPKDFVSFYAAMGEDEPILPIIKVLEALWEREENTIILLTGREGSPQNRRATGRWLEHHLDGLVPWFIRTDPDPYDALECSIIPVFMRYEKDYRSDDIVKSEMLEEIFDSYNQYPDMVFDDRKRVVDMWRRHGILALQVAEGDF